MAIMALANQADWVLRGKALLDTIDTLGEMTKPMSLLNFARKAELDSVVKALRPFAEAHYNFFLNGFTNGTLTPSKEFPPDYVLREVVKRIATDTETIENIIGQRIIHQVGTSEANCLKQAELIAREVLSSKFPTADPSTMTVIAYFARDTLIRLVPYANVAIIGIPVATTEVPTDYLAICHEAGHYVFWNSLTRPDWKALRDEAKVRATWLENWVEELYADVYGASAGGAAMAFDWQDYQELNAPAQLLEDDADHPIPILRPEIYLRVLELKGYGQALVDVLRQRWQIKVSDKLAPAPLPQNLTLNGLLVDRLAASAIVKNYVDYLMGEPRAKLSDVEPLWTKSGESSDINALYAQFKAAIDTGTKYDPALHSPTDTVVAKTWTQWTTQKNFAAGSTLEDHWFQVFQAEGWTSEGPHSQPPWLP